MESTIKHKIKQLDSSIVTEALSNGKLYVRKNGTWVEALSAVHLKYTTQALMIAGRPNQILSYIYFDGTYYYEYLGTVLGTIADYRMLGADMTLGTDQTVSGLKTFLYDKLGMRNAANTFTSFFRNSNTAQRLYTLPNKDGTVAMTSDILAQLNGVVNYLVKFGTATTGVVSRLWDTGTYFGIGVVNTPSKDITLGNQSTKEIGIELSDSTTIGRNLIISAGRTINYVLSSAWLPLSDTYRVYFKFATDVNNNTYATTNSDIYIRTNGLGNFVGLGQTGRSWRGIAVHPNTNVYAVVNNGDIYMRTGGAGAFVALGQTSRAWTGIACHINGDVYACVYNGDIYKQTSGAGAFVALGGALRYWWDLDSSNTGNIYGVAGDNYTGAIYKQTSGVGDFINISAQDIGWRVITVSKVSNDVYAGQPPNGNAGYIFKQTNENGAFVNNGTPTGFWTGIGSDINGNIYASSHINNYIQNNANLGTANLDGGTLINKAGTGKGTGKSRYQIVTGQKTVSGTDMQIETVRAEFDESGNYTRFSTPTFADNASALAGGLTVGMEYKTATGVKMEVY